MTRNERPLPEALLDAARRLSTGELQPVTPRRAATVVLLRTAGTGFEVYTIRRAASMAFASGMFAFPGGVVDHRDATEAVDWAGPTPAEWAVRLGTDDEAEARAVVSAAVRETFEESGVLLAGPGPDTVVGDVSGPEWERARQALVGRELPFTRLLAERHLVLRSDLLAAWARWVTPEFEPRRYDTCFFVARLPDAQRTRDVSGETDGVAWVSPDEALRRHGRGEMAMLPPTVATLTELAGHGTVAAALRAAATRDMTPVMPRAVFTVAGARLVWDTPDSAG